MLLQFVQKRLSKAPSALALEDIDAPLVMAFLDEMERARGITALHAQPTVDGCASFFRFAAFEAPMYSAQIQRVLAIPAKRYTHAGAIPQPTGGRRAAGCAGSAKLVRSP